MATTSMKRKKFRKHKFLEDQVNSGSYIIWSDDNVHFGGVAMTLSDCARTISWDFGAPGEKRAKKKIAVIKKIIDEVYEYLHEEV